MDQVAVLSRVQPNHRLLLTDASAPGFVRRLLGRAARSSAESCADQNSSLGGIQLRWTSTRTINAPADRVFRAVADPEEFQNAIPGGSKVEYLTSNRTGVGTKFRSTRLMKGKPSTFEQEVTEFVPPERVRLVNVTHETVWDTTFSVRVDGGATVLTLTMDSQTDRFVARLMTRLIAGMVQKALDGDMDAVKAYCERQPPLSGGA